MVKCLVPPVHLADTAASHNAPDNHGHTYSRCHVPAFLHHHNAYPADEPGPVVVVDFTAAMASKIALQAALLLGAPAT